MMPGCAAVLLALPVIMRKPRGQGLMAALAMPA
jgi:hypothetical protein